MRALAATLLLGMLLWTLPAPAAALAGDLAPATLTVTTTSHGNTLSWEYPDGVEAKMVSSIEVWRFDGSNSGSFVAKVHGKHTSFVDQGSVNVDALYTMRYFTKDGEQSSFSQATSDSLPPYCNSWLTVDVFNSPYIIMDSRASCYVPPALRPTLNPTVQSGIAALQNVVG